MSAQAGGDQASSKAMLVFSYLTGATYYRAAIAAYSGREEQLRDRLLEEYTTISLVAALIITLSFGLFLQAPQTIDALNSSNASQPYLVLAGRQYSSDVIYDMFGICSSMSVGFMLLCVLFATLFIFNASLIPNPAFPSFMTDHIYILALPVGSLGAGLLCMGVAMMAWGLIAYSQRVAIFNIVFLCVAGASFLLLFIWGLVSRFVRTTRFVN